MGDRIDSRWNAAASHVTFDCLGAMVLDRSGGDFLFARFDRPVLAERIYFETAQLARANVRGDERRIDGRTAGVLYGTDAVVASDACEINLRRNALLLHFCAAR